MELGVYTFGDLVPDVRTGEKPTAERRMADLIEHAKIADAAGLDVFAVGEHHRDDFVVSSPEVVLAAIASVTERIRLSSAVTVLSTRDPVRAFEEFATLDLISGGRAEIIAGRGAFTESFPLFGFDTKDYETLFDERIRLLLQLAKEERPVWRGTTRAPLNGEFVAPRPVQDPLPVWIGVGGTPRSAVRAGTLGAPMFLALFTGPHRARGIVDLYHRSAQKAGHDPASLRIASGGHMFIGRTSQGAKDAFYPYYSEYFKINPQMATGMPRSMYDAWLADGLVVGSPQEVIDKIMLHHDALGITRYVGQFDVGGMPEGMVRESLELFAEEVAPVLRRETRAALVS